MIRDADQKVKDHCISPISWTPCSDNPRFECAPFEVPLDYAHPHKGSATLALARLKSRNPKHKGTIMTNPGGPGSSGVNFLLSGGGEIINTITGNEFDILSWDPRGVNHSRPSITCGFSTPESLQDFLGDSILADGIEVRGDFTQKDDLDSFFSKVNETDSLIVEMGQKCMEANGAFLPFMGTTATVRDMVSIWDCLEHPAVEQSENILTLNSAGSDHSRYGHPQSASKVNFWGFSYGTVIGSYFVNMFPERVGRVVIDGVVDIERQARLLISRNHSNPGIYSWATKPTIIQAQFILNDAEKALEGFAESCAQAGPANCSLAQPNATGPEIFSELVTLIETAYNLTKEGLDSVTSFDVRNLLWGLMAFPSIWSDIGVPEIEQLISVLEGEAGSLTSSRRRRRSLSMKGIPGSSDTTIDPGVASFITQLAISCLDSVNQQDITTLQLFETVVNVTREISPLFGEVLVTEPPAFCHRFPIRAMERFTGPFDHALAYPILVIGNEASQLADPITPFRNAQRAADLLGKSARLVKQDGIGHTSFGMNSDCTQSIIRDYFSKGTLPKNGVICPTDQALFPLNATVVSNNPLLI